MFSRATSVVWGSWAVASSLPKHETPKASGSEGCFRAGEGAGCPLALRRAGPGLSECPGVRRAQEASTRPSASAPQSRNSGSERVQGRPAVRGRAGVGRAGRWWLWRWPWGNRGQAAWLWDPRPQGHSDLPPARSRYRGSCQPGCWGLWEGGGGCTVWGSAGCGTQFLESLLPQPRPYTIAGPPPPLPLKLTPDSQVDSWVPLDPEAGEAPTDAMEGWSGAPSAAHGHQCRMVPRGPRASHCPLSVAFPLAPGAWVHPCLGDSGEASAGVSGFATPSLS